MRKRYSTYRKSRIPSIVLIPDHWSETRLTYLFTFGKGLNITKENLVDDGIPCINYGEIHSKFGFEVNPETDSLKCVVDTFLDTAPKALLKKGDFIFADTSEDIEGSGNFTYYNSSETAFAGYHTIIAKPKGMGIPRYFAYLFDSSAFRAQVQKEVNGTKVFSITNSILKDAVVLLPPEDEQQAIVNFLDRKTARIDSLSKKNIAYIEKLRQKRTALISQTITKGISPSYNLKASGVEYIGDIPDHWDVKRLRYLGKCQNGISKDGASFGSGFPFLSYGDVYKNSVIPFEVSGLVESSDDERDICSVKEQDVFFTRTSETIEEIGIASVCLKTILDATFAGFLIRFRPFPGLLDVNYSKYYFRAEIHRRFFVKEMNIVTRASLSQELLKRLPVLLPPISEQKIIAEYLDKETLKIDKTILKLEEANMRLVEYRRSLINAAVIGEIDVREKQ